MSLSDYVALSVKIDWNNDGDFSDANENVSAYALYPLRTSRGRASVNDEFSAGTGRFRLDNRDGRFSPFSATSPIYPNVLPGRPVKIEATYDGNTYPIFYGRCTPVAQNANATDPYVEFEMIDAFEELRLGLTNTPLAVSARVDTVIDDILDDVSWPAGLRSLDTAVSRLTFFTNHNRLPLNAIQLAAKHELGGRLFVGKNGHITFKNRHAAGEASVKATLTGTFDQVDPQVRQEDLIDYVRVTYPRLSLDTAYSEVFNLTVPLPVPANSTLEADFAIDVQGGIGATFYETPLVAGTHFQANSQPDGSGTSKNAQISITIPDAVPPPGGLSLSAGDSGGGTMEIVNTDGSTVYLTMLKVNARVLRKAEDFNVVRKNATAPLITGQNFSQDFEFSLSDANAIDGWASYQAEAKSRVRARPVVQIGADTDALMELLLDLELGDKLELSDSGAAWLTQIDNVYVVEGIECEISGPASVRSTLRLFDRELAQASFFKISGAAGAGQDYSEIVSAVATVGDGFVF